LYGGKNELPMNFISLISGRREEKKEERGEVRERKRNKA
jgi:hypothetical protein